LKLPNADCSLKNKFIVLFIRIFGTLSFPDNLNHQRWFAPHYGLQLQQQTWYW